VERIRFFGPTNARFDHQDDPQRQPQRHLYAALSPLTYCRGFRRRVVDRGARQPWLVGFDIVQDLQLLDLCGTWPTRAGASMAINTGPRPRARRWSRLIHATYANIEGLRYPSSMNANEPSVALYERAQSAVLGVAVFNRALADPALAPRLGSAAATIGYRIV
jgi:hypothetical protein